MIDEFSHYAIKLSVAQICQNIGWTSITTTSLNILEDLLSVYINSLAKISHNYAELFGQCEPNLDHLGLAFKDMGISIAELEEYVANVDSSAVLEVPKYPLPRESHLNLLKPGSREVVTRPVHIHEHLPPMHPHLEEEGYPLRQSPLSAEAGGDGISPLSSPQSCFKKPEDPGAEARRVKVEEEARPLREISSVMMTTSGFLSHAREGKLPEARTQPLEEEEEEAEELPLEPQPPPPPPPPPAEPKPEKKKKSKSEMEKKAQKEIEDKERQEEDDIFKSLMKDISKLKPLKTSALKVPTGSQTSSKHRSQKQRKEKEVSLFDHSHKVSKVKSPKREKKVISPTSRAPLDIFKESHFETDVKLSSEPDKHKLNIFKKISKVKEEHDEQKAVSPANRDLAIPVEEAPLKPFQVESSVKEKSVQGGSQAEMGGLSPCDLSLAFSEDPLTMETPKTPRTPDLPRFSEHKKKKKDKHKEKKEVTEYQELSPKPRLVGESVEKPKTPEVATRDEDFFSSSPAGLIPAWNPSLISYLYSNSPGVPAPPLPPPVAPKDPVPPPPPVALVLPPSAALVPPQAAIPSSAPKEGKSEGISKKKLHKEEKRLRLKKKKEKKDKSKSKEKSEKKKLKLEKKEKEKLKKSKKEKKKEREMAAAAESIGVGAVPKITFKLTPVEANVDSGTRKIVIKPVERKEEEVQEVVAKTSRHNSPHRKGHKGTSKSGSKAVEAIPTPLVVPPPSAPPLVPPPPASMPLEPTKIWICPACNHPDDGSPMIACDMCDLWFHYFCVGIQVAPESDWFCNRCIIKKSDVWASDKRKKRRKK